RRKAFALRLSVRDRSTRPVTPINFLQKFFLQLVHFISYVPASFLWPHRLIGAAYFTLFAP
ncbi:hypothetical protein ACFPOH_03050, partial [Ureibacillus suwonensis]